MNDREILHQNADEIEAYLLRLFERHVQQIKIVKILFRLWKKHLESGLTNAKPLTLNQLCVEMDYPIARADSLKVDVSRARKMLRDASSLYVSGYIFKTKIEEKAYALKITVLEDSEEPLRRFWQCHLPSPDDHAPVMVAIGIFARLFFSIDDELFLRASSVNRPDAVIKDSLLEQILSKHKHTVTRQYVASGEVGAAFSLMEMFNTLGATVKGVRVFAEASSNGIVMGSGIDEHNVTGPLFRYSVVSAGISSDGGASPTFIDDWNSPTGMSIHVLLNRWYDDEKDSFVTAIYSGSSHAVEGVCYVLSHEKRVKRLLDAVDYQPSNKASQLVLKVELQKIVAGSRFTRVSVWDGKTFVLFWPRRTDIPIHESDDR